MGHGFERREDACFPRRCGFTDKVDPHERPGGAVHRHAPTAFALASFQCVLQSNGNQPIEWMPLTAASHGPPAVSSASTSRTAAAAERMPLRPSWVVPYFAA